MVIANLEAPTRLVLPLLVACTGATGDSAGNSDASAPPDIGPLSRYLGQSEVEQVTEDGTTTTYEFSTDGRARCMRGAPFRASTRATDSRDLVFFLQGGGACWDGFCLAVTEAPEGIPTVDILNPTVAENPTADWNITYLPYCDGSLFVGDADHDDDGDGTDDRLHRGLANLSAALDVSKRQFPSPDRVLFAGSSGGGFGVSLALPLVAAVYPDAEVIALADSAVGIARGPADPGFVTGLMTEWEAEDLMPAGCESCLDDGHLVPVIEHHLGEHPDIRLGVFAAWYDSIIGDVFLGLSPAEHRDAVESETGRAHAAFPDRYRRFLIDGRMHTTMLGDATGIVGSNLDALEYPPEILGALASIELGSLSTTTAADGTPVHAWLAGLIDGDPEAWLDVVDPAGPEPVGR